MQVKLLLIAILASLSVIDASSILLVFALPGKSHAILGDGFVRWLLAAGHQVSVVSLYSTSVQNLTLVKKHNSVSITVCPFGLKNHQSFNLCYIISIHLISILLTDMFSLTLRSTYT